MYTEALARRTVCCPLSGMWESGKALHVTGVTTASSGTASSGTSTRHSSDSRV